MSGYSKVCACQKSSCDCHCTGSSSKSSPITITNAFENNNSVDQILIQRLTISTDHCGRPSPRVQQGAISGEDLLEYISSRISTSFDVCQAIGPVPANPTQLCYTR